MSLIQSRLNQRLLINLKGGKNINLLAKGTANVTEEDLSSPHLQSLLANGDIRVVQKSVGVVQKNIGVVEKKTSEGIEKKKGSPETQPSKSKP